MKKVTIISGYYNREDFVDESIKSLLNQTYKNYDIIIFDDSSTDNTHRNLLKHESPNLKIIRHKNNIGFVKGLINTINSTDSEYIAIHGSGDISLPDRIAKQVDILDNDKNCMIVGSHYCNIDLLNNTQKIVKGKQYYNKNELLKKNPLSHGEVMYRKKNYEKVGGYKDFFKFSQDYDLWLRMCKYGYVYIVQELLYKRIIQRDGVSYEPKKLIQQKKYSYLAKESNKNESFNLESFHSINDIKFANSLKFNISIFKMYNVLMFKGLLHDEIYFINNSSRIFKIYYIVTRKIYSIVFFKNCINYFYKKFFPLYRNIINL